MTTTQTVTTPAPTPQNVRPTLAVSYAQSPTNSEDVTWTATVTSPDPILPLSVLSITVATPGSGNDALCSVNVGGSSASDTATCTATIPAGQYTVTVDYAGGYNAQYDIEPTVLTADEHIL